MHTCHLDLRIISQIDTEKVTVATGFRRNIELLWCFFLLYRFGIRFFGSILPLDLLQKSIQTCDQFCRVAIGITAIR